MQNHCKRVYCLFSWRPLLLGWSPSLVGWGPSLHANNCNKYVCSCFSLIDWNQPDRLSVTITCRRVSGGDLWGFVRPRATDTEANLARRSGASTACDGQGMKKPHETTIYLMSHCVFYCNLRLALRVFLGWCLQSWLGGCGNCALRKPASKGSIAVYWFETCERVVWLQVLADKPVLPPCASWFQMQPFFLAMASNLLAD